MLVAQVKICLAVGVLIQHQSVSCRAGRHRVQRVSVETTNKLQISVDCSDGSRSGLFAFYSVCKAGKKVGSFWSFCK